MKRYFTILSLILVVGCDFVQSDLEFKEKCSKFIASAEERIEKQNENEKSKLSIYTYIGTFYSRKLSSCISIIKEEIFPDVPHPMFLRHYYDELTGQNLGIQSDMDYEETLELLR